MDDLYNGVFFRAAKNGSNCYVNVRNVYKTIPKSSFKEPRDNKDNTEWRWRFLQFGPSLKVEISKKKPNENRIYLNEKNEWVTRDIDPRFDKYVSESYYYYAKIKEYEE
jgi:hypothetical protein